MDDLDLPDWVDRHRAARIAQLRGLGYTQAQIAKDLGVSQQTVSRYTKAINEAAREADSVEDFFAGLLLLGLGAAAGIALYKAFGGGGRPPGYL